jgi:DNA-binding transcriptional LysR family regulator
LQLLEDELGAPLFVRTRQGVLLTEAGRLVREQARALVERWERMVEAVAALANLEAGTLRVGGGATAVSYLLPAAIAEFQRAHPAVLFQLREAGSREVEREVTDERLELGLVTLPVASGEFVMRPLLADRIVLVAALGHPLAQREGVPVEALEGCDLVAFESPSAIRSLIDSALAAAGVRVKVVMELRSIPAILRLVVATGGLAFVSQLGVAAGAGDVRVVPVTGLSLERRLALISKRGRPLSPAATAFAKLLRRG